MLKHLAEQARLADLIEVDSAGTGSWHAGDDMDERSRQVLTDAGYDVPPHVARQFRADDFAGGEAAEKGAFQEVVFGAAAGGGSAGELGI